MGTMLLFRGCTNCLSEEKRTTQLCQSHDQVCCTDPDPFARPVVRQSTVDKIGHSAKSAKFHDNITVFKSDDRIHFIHSFFSLLRLIHFLFVRSLNLDLGKFPL